MKSNRQRKKELLEKKGQRRFRKRVKEGGLANGVAMPRHSIAADLSKQTPCHNSYSPRKFYTDCEFKCEDCGSAEVWTAIQKKKYYETFEGSIYGEAIRCRRCRIKRREQKSAQPVRSEQGQIDKVTGVNKMLVGARRSFDN